MTDILSDSKSFNYGLDGELGRAPTVSRERRQVNAQHCSASWSMSITVNRSLQRCLWSCSEGNGQGLGQEPLPTLVDPAGRIQP